MSLYDELGDEVRNKTRNLMQNIQQLRQLIDTFIKNSKTENQATHKFVSDVVNDNPLTNFTFTGKDTDLSYFLQSERMPVSAIRNIADSDIKDAVTNTFVKAAENDLIELDGNDIKITEKGKEKINKPDFIKSAQKDQSEAYNQKINSTLSKGCMPNEVQMCAELTGDYINDFTFFNHSDNLDLSTVISHPDKQLSSKILANVKQWQTNGAVTVKDGVATITDMGKQMLKMPEFQSIANNPVVEKALSATGVGKVIVATKKIVQAMQSVQQVTNTISKGSR